MDKNLTIFVLPRGQVVVGKPDESDIKDFCEIRLINCATVRRWGTTKGLGQLAAEGPGQNTILDKEPDGTTINKLHIYRTLRCNESAWFKYLQE